MSGLFRHNNLLLCGTQDNNRDFKIGDYGRLGRLDRCHVTKNTRDLLPSSSWDGMFSPGFSS